MHRGLISPMNHGMEYVSNFVLDNADLIWYLSIEVRDYWIHGVTSAPKTFDDYTDGIVAIHPLSTAARKVKDIFSVEVKVANESMSLITAEGNEILREVKRPVPYSDGSIVEYRLRPVPNTNKARVINSIKRPDKNTANSINAVVNIVNIYLGTQEDKGENERRRALTW